MRLRAENVTTIIELQDWARRLHRHGRYPCDPVRRFAIGFYQLHQAFDWRGTDSEYESYAAAAIHVLASAEALEIPTESAARHAGIADIPFGSDGDTRLLHDLSAVQSQIVYATNSSSIGRKSRFDKPTAAIYVSAVVYQCLSRIPVEKRQEAIYKAMEIMTGEL